MTDLTTQGRLPPDHADLVFAVLTIPRNPKNAERDEARQAKDQRLAALNAEIASLQLWADSHLPGSRTGMDTQK